MKESLEEEKKTTGKDWKSQRSKLIGRAPKCSKKLHISLPALMVTFKYERIYQWTLSDTEQLGNRKQMENMQIFPPVS